MVKLGFIVEGGSEKIILQSPGFFSYLQAISVQFIPEIIDAEGNGNLLPHNIVEFTKILEEKGATKIIVLTDLDLDQCITLTKQRISPLPNHVVVVSVKQIESWFLADTVAICNFLNDQNYHCEYPESQDNPFSEIKNLRIARNGRRVSDKKILARLMIRSGFLIEEAAKHPNCNSVKYFLQTIERESNNN